MKILICGSKGQLGSDCSLVFNKGNEVLGVDLDEIDICNSIAVDSMVKDFKPSIIINCAAFTNVDACETNREIAWQVNVNGPLNLAEAVKKYGGRLVHISTDYVFDGMKNPPDFYLENDSKNPVSYYGLTKHEGEEAVIRGTYNHIIIRTAWLYGMNGHNFLKTILKLAVKSPEKKIKVVNDQFGSPTWSYRLARQIEKIIQSGSLGIFHATSEGYCSWFDLASYFLKIMKVKNNIVSCSTQEYPTPAGRPANSILENFRLKKEGIQQMKDWQHDLNQFVKKYRNELIMEA